MGTPEPAMPASAYAWLRRVRSVVSQHPSGAPFAFGSSSVCLSAPELSALRLLLTPARGVRSASFANLVGYLSRGGWEDTGLAQVLPALVPTAKDRRDDRLERVSQDRAMSAPAAHPPTSVSPGADIAALHAALRAHLEAVRHRHAAAESELLRWMRVDSAFAPPVDSAFAPPVDSASAPPVDSGRLRELVASEIHPPPLVTDLLASPLPELRRIGKTMVADRNRNLAAYRECDAALVLNRGLSTELYAECVGPAQLDAQTPELQKVPRAASALKVDEDWYAAGSRARRVLEMLPRDDEGVPKPVDPERPFLFGTRSGFVELVSWEVAMLVKFVVDVPRVLERYQTERGADFERYLDLLETSKRPEAQAVLEVLRIVMPFDLGAFDPPLGRGPQDQDLVPSAPSKCAAVLKTKTHPAAKFLSWLGSAVATGRLPASNPTIHLAAKRFPGLLEVCEETARDVSRQKAALRPAVVAGADGAPKKRRRGTGRAATAKERNDALLEDFETWEREHLEQLLVRAQSHIEATEETPAVPRVRRPAPGLRDDACVDADDADDDDDDADE